MINNEEQKFNELFSIDIHVKVRVLNKPVERQAEILEVSKLRRK